MPATHLDAAAMARISGGWQLSGTAPADGMSPQWPPVGGPSPLTVSVDARGRSSHGVDVALMPTPTATPAAPLPSTPGSCITPVPRQCLPLSPWGPTPTLSDHLIPNPANAMLPLLVWDVRVPPELAKRIWPRCTIGPIKPYLSTPATTPQVPRVHVAWRANAFARSARWGAIVADKGGADGAVSVGDVLDAIYEYFQTQITPDEAEELAEDFPALWTAACAAFEKRCREFLGIPEVARQQGMRRVDCLEEKHTFWGMWVTHDAQRRFYLNLALVPPTPTPSRRASRR